ncbi:hypothetical protein GH811_13430 [Acetobacterium malicum]|uniref:DUF7662 domain-containing protein n=1 Tax=Acetobacterium malicum TaxID=52692 RepID=A0ABR6YZD6_9FIRM|nr:hypothetical protein [Acetobacterium malicum]MBC3900617.1 hypothetical protein [Acetobacterium malicum]
MSKYIDLMRFLRESHQVAIELTYKEIEEIIGSNLPPSAYDNAQAWWSNSRSHTQANAWLDAGYETDSVSESYKDEVILFVKVD